MESRPLLTQLPDHLRVASHTRWILSEMGGGESFSAISEIVLEDGCTPRDAAEPEHRDRRLPVDACVAS